MSIHPNQLGTQLAFYQASGHLPVETSPAFAQIMRTRGLTLLPDTLSLLSRDRAQDVLEASRLAAPTRPDRVRQLLELARTHQDPREVTSIRGMYRDTLILSEKARQHRPQR